MHRWLSPIVPCCLLALLTACAPGPDFVRPTAPRVTRYTDKPIPQTAAAPGKAGASQTFTPVSALPAAWWHVFHAPALDQLVRMALKNSPGLVQSEATLAEAQATLEADVDSALYPAVTGNLSAERIRNSPATFGIPGAKANEFNLYNASVNVTYSIDTSGGARRTLEALRAQVRYQSYELAAARLALTANVITTAIQAASLQAQVQATRQVLVAEQRALSIIQQQFALGGIAQAGVLTQETAVAQVSASLPTLEAQQSRARHALALLTGQLPASAKLPPIHLRAIHLPPALPLTLPSSLVRQRPDVRAAQALLHVASAEVGVAAAAELPQLNLSASYGSGSTTVSGLFTGPTMLWNAAAGLVTPIFNGGALRAKRRGAEAAYKAASGAYRVAVLTAFQNVADALRALEFDAASLAAQSQAAHAAKIALHLTRAQRRFGGVSVLALLTAEQQYQQTQIALIQARAARLADTAALYQALGGGWWATRQEQRISTAHSRNRRP